MNFKKNKYKDLPSVNEVLLNINGSILLNNNYLKYLINNELNNLRIQINDNKLSKNPEEILTDVVNVVKIKSSNSLVNLINGSGIVLHTGFGRAPFRSRILKRIANRMEGYVNLEFDLDSGKRGDRQLHLKEHLSSICGSESSLCVNNNAAAVMLAINEIAKGGEVIVSRGQLVEIGGSFRIPDIIAKSGATLKEVGTTNRTHNDDYKNAITKKTKLLLWVHTSNYVVKGFTRSVPLSDLIQFGKNYKIPVMVDWGSGSLLDMKSLGLADEIPVRSIMKHNPDILTFSGDKLIGGPQSGLVIGKKKWIDALYNNPLYRVFRCNKITIALLEEILRSYHSNGFTEDNLSLKLLTTSRNILKNRGKKILEYQSWKRIKDLGMKLKNSEVEAGSGSLPDKLIKSVAISFQPRLIRVNDLARRFRLGQIPVVGYIKNNIFYIDLKAVLPNQVDKLAKAIQEV